MKKTVVLLTFLAVVGCKNKTTETQNQASVLGAKESAATPSVSDSNCAKTGELVDKFEQNGAKFERFRKKTDPEVNDQTDEWLKITLPNGGCSVVDSIGEANHYGCAFEDWDKDGFKDMVEYFKWNSQVRLFSKQTNSFELIDGYFNGEQWDFDKEKGLKWQHLEDKMGETFQLYKLEGLTLRPYAEVRFEPTENDGYAIFARKNPVKTAEGNTFTEEKMKPKTFLLPPKERGEEQYEAMIERWKASVKRYWDKNLTQILK